MHKRNAENRSKRKLVCYVTIDVSDHLEINYYYVWSNAVNWTSFEIKFELKTFNMKPQE